LINSNLKLVRNSVTKATANIDVAARMARDEMMAALIQLSKELIAGARPYTKGPRGGRVYEKATPGEPPMNRTGDLRRSIRGEKAKAGFGNYVAIVGPTIEYGRRVELGGGNWPAGTRFPYMEPAYAQFRSQVAPAITAKYFRRFR
jgi:phage gpG-like protein